jgi:hypothetical protein
MVIRVEQGKGQKFAMSCFPQSCCKSCVAVEVADVFRRYGEAYRQEHGARAARRAAKP